MCARLTETFLRRDVRAARGVKLNAMPIQQGIASIASLARIEREYRRYDMLSSR